MRIEELWSALEIEAAAGGESAWLLRRATPNPGYPLFVALEATTGSRALLLPVPGTGLRPRREWPECSGLELQTVALDAEPYLAVRLRARDCSDVFTALAEDVAPRLAAASNGARAFTVLLDRLRQWQKFLVASRGGLDRDQERGLWGELHVLRSHMIPALGAAPALAAWKANEAAHQDFQCIRGALEVKTSAAKQPQSIRITSERQLDDTGVGTLFLHVLTIDEREVAPGDAVPGQSLPGIIAELRGALARDAAALTAFSDRLLDAGYLDAQAPRYDGRRRTVRREQSFQVTAGFPRITEQGLPAGVGDVSYALDLTACSPYQIQTPQMLAALIENTNLEGR